MPHELLYVMLHTSPLDEPGTKDAGGMNVVVRSQAMALTGLGQRVRVVTRRNDPAQAALTQLVPGLTVQQLDAGPPRVLPKGEHEALIAPFTAELFELLRHERPQLLHTHHWYSGLAALPVAKALGLPLVHSYHSIAAAADAPLGEGERAEAPGRLAGERRLAAEAELIVTVSEAERRTVIDRLGAAPERVRVVPPGVDTALFRPLFAGEDRMARGESDRQGSEVTGGEAAAAQVPEVLIVGRLDPLKRFDLAIAALAEVPEKSRPALCIVGEAAPDGAAYEQSLRAAVDRCGLANRVVFAGALGRAELADRMRRAALVLVPSYSETYGLVALEAAASGVPVIAAAVGGLCEAVVNGETGVLLASDNPQLWGATMLQLLSDRKLHDRMGAAARAHALEHTWQRSAERLLAVYREFS